MTTISVIVRSIGRPSLAAAIDSIVRQTTRPNEIVVIDALGTGQVVVPAIAASDIAVRLHGENRRLNYSEAANAGLDHASGDLLMFLDDDDFYDRRHVELLRATLAAQPPSCLLAYAATRAVDANGREIGVMAREFGHLSLFRKNPAQIGAALFSRKLLDRGCRFDVALEAYEDWDFWLQAAEHTAFAFSATPTLNWAAQAGGSGAGIGINFDPEQHVRRRNALQAKWSTRIAALERQFQSLLDEGRRAHAAGDASTARKRYVAALQLDRYDGGALNLLGMLFFEQGRLKDAEGVLNAAVSNDPESAAWRFNRARVLRAAGHVRAAVEDLRAVLAMEPTHADAARLLAELSAGKGM